MMRRMHFEHHSTESLIECWELRCERLDGGRRVEKSVY